MHSSRSMLAKTGQRLRHLLFRPTTDLVDLALPMLAECEFDCGVACTMSAALSMQRKAQLGAVEYFWRNRDCAWCRPNHKRMLSRCRPEELSGGLTRKRKRAVLTTFYEQGHSQVHRPVVTNWGRRPFPHSTPSTCL